MKINLPKAFPLLSLCLIALTGSTMPGANDGLAVYNKVSKALNSLKTIQYTYRREFNYPSEGYLSKIEGQMYLDFITDAQLVGFRYQYSHNGEFTTFNGSEIFSNNLEDKTLRIKRNLTPASFEGNSWIYHSMVTLRNALPMVMADNSIVKTVTDTLVSGKRYYNLKFVLPNKLLTYLGTGYSPVTIQRTFVYKILVDPATNLPVTVLQTNTINNDLNRTDFVNATTKTQPPAETSWYSSNYLKDYALATEGKHELIKANIPAPDWQLTSAENNAAVNLSQYRGKLVLLEFWIKNCSYCIGAVHKLNAMQQQYPNNKFKILAINMEDYKEMIAVFKTSISRNTNSCTETIKWIKLTVSSHFQQLYW
ncbi:peroxiredoxin [Mucilaginibacter galii]|nr:redoxin domain-containing protein [Mucilaginibacter galii]